MPASLRDASDDRLAAALRLRGYTVTPPSEQQDLADLDAIDYVRQRELGVRVANAVRTSRSRGVGCQHVETTAHLAEATRTGDLRKLCNIGRETERQVAQALRNDGLM